MGKRVIHTVSFLLLVVSLASAGAAHAGLADRPLPLLLSGTSTKHVFSIPGVIHSGRFETMFACTSLDSQIIRVAVEVFGHIGGGALNDVTTGNGAQNVTPGATVIIATELFTPYPSSQKITGLPTFYGSARILSTSTKIACRAFLTNDTVATSELSVVKGKTQKGD